MNVQLPISLTDSRGKSYIVKRANQSGGKAGKGHNKTSTIQVMYNSMVIKQCRYKVDDHESFKAAILTALSYCVGDSEATYIFKNGHQDNRDQQG